MEPIRFSVVSSNCSNTNGPRLGTLTRSNSRIDTPTFMFYTKSGSVPYITREVFDKILPNDQVLFNHSLPTNVNLYETLKEYKLGLNKFVGFENYFSCCSITDYAVETRQGFNVKDKVAIKSKSGNQLITYERYMDIMEVFKPDMYVTLCISNTNLDSVYSAIEKSVNISNRLFNSCLERHKKSETLKGSGLIAPIQGGYNVKERIRSAKYLAEYNDVLGFLFDGFFTDGSTVEDIPCDIVMPVITETMECLPSDKMKIIFGAWTPALIIDLINSGIDMFDSTFPHLTTENNCALIFDYNLKYKNNGIILNIPNNSDKNREKLNNYEICLTDVMYFESFEPLKDGCTCLTCQKHTKAYVHHLLVSNETLGPVLLTIHNLHYFYQFFKDIREVLLKNKHKQ